MRWITWMLAVLAGITAVSGTARAVNVVPFAKADSTSRSLLAADRKFSDASLKKGMRASFLDYLTDDALLFRPRPVNGKKFLTLKETNPLLLSWEPTYAEVSISGDFGLTIGTWKVRQKPDAQPLGRGEYANVWRRGPGGPWRVAVDIGITHGRPTFDPTPWGVYQRPPITWRATRRGGAFDLSSGAQRQLVDSLVGVDRTLSGETAGNLIGAYRRLAADDFQWFRMWRFPYLGLDSVDVVAGAGRSAFHSSPDSALVARSGDLGCTWGYSVSRGSESSPPDSSSYLRVWRREPLVSGVSGQKSYRVDWSEWRLVMEMMDPIRPKTAADVPGATKQ